MSSSISVVIPTLNEGDGIGPLVKKCTAFASEVIIVDGNSQDKTVENAKKNGGKIIIEPRRGYGQAYLTGFNEAHSEIIATADGDGTYPVELIPEIAERLTKENLAFISCSRFPLETKDSMPLTNYLGNSLLSAAGSILWLHAFQDILSGMWVFRKDVLKEIELYSKNWNLSQEIKIAAYIRYRERFKEVAIPYRERVGTPKLSPFRVGTENLTFFFVQRLGLRKLLSKP